MKMKPMRPIVSEENEKKEEKEKKERVEKNEINEKKPLTLEEAKKNFRAAMHNASPLRLIEENPGVSTGVALCVGVALGSRGVVRRGAKLASAVVAGSSGRLFVQALTLLAKKVAR